MPRVPKPHLDILGPDYDEEADLPYVERAQRLTEKLLDRIEAIVANPEAKFTEVQKSLYVLHYISQRQPQGYNQAMRRAVRRAGPGAFQVDRTQLVSEIREALRSLGPEVVKRDILQGLFPPRVPAPSPVPPAPSCPPDSQRLGQPTPPLAAEHGAADGAGVPIQL